MYLQKRHVSLAMAYFSAFISTYNLQITLDLPAKMLLPAWHFLRHFHVPDKRLKKIVRNCVGLTYPLVFFSSVYTFRLILCIHSVATSPILILLPGLFHNADYSIHFWKDHSTFSSLKYVQWNLCN